MGAGGWEEGRDAYLDHVELLAWDDNSADAELRSHAICTPTQ